MRWLATTALILVLLAATSPLGAEDDARKKFLLELGKSLTSGNSGAVAAHFPGDKKVELSLRGVKRGRYRSGQAKSLLATYLSRTIQPIKYVLKDVRGSVGKFSMEYRVRADGRRVTGTTCVYLEESGDSWNIVGIVEY